MTLTKVQAEGINLADTFAFTGTVSGTSVAGTDAFSANSGASNWASVAANTIIVFDDDSDNDNFDTDSRYDTSTYKYTARAAGVYMFWYSIYAAESDSSNAFGFLRNATKVNMFHGTDNKFTSRYGDSEDHTQNGMVIISLNANDTMAVIAVEQSDYYRGH